MNQKNPHSINDYLVGNHGAIWFILVFMVLVFIGAITRLAVSEERMIGTQFVKVYISGLFLSIIAFIYAYKKHWAGVDVMAALVLVVSLLAEFFLVYIVQRGYEIAQIIVMGAVNAAVSSINQKIKDNKNTDNYIEHLNYDAEEQNDTDTKADFERKKENDA